MKTTHQTFVQHLRVIAYIVLFCFLLSFSARHSVALSKRDATRLHFQTLTRQQSQTQGGTATAPQEVTRPRTTTPQQSPLPPPPPPPRRTEPAPEPAPSETQTPAAEIDVDEVLNVASKLVVVPVSVTDAEGESVQDLTAEDFRIEERGRVQEIAALGDPEEVPLDLVLLLDVSGSVRDRFSFEREAAVRFLRQVLKPADRATIFFVDAQPRLINTRLKSEDAVQRLLGSQLSDDKLTAFYDTVVEAANYLRTSTPPKHRRVIISISDGDDTYSERVRQELRNARGVLPELQKAEVVFYSLNPSGNSLWLNVRGSKAQAELEKIAAATGGAAFVPGVVEDLDKVFRRITAELRSQYLLQYYSNNEAAPGQFLPIKVTTPGKPNLRVRARQGYYASTPK